LTGAPLVAVSSWRYPDSFGYMPVPSDVNWEKAAEEVLAKSAAELPAGYPEVHVDVRLQQGHPAQILIEQARGASLLVVGSRGHGAFTGMLLGSVSQHCVTHAPCPVVVVRPSAEPLR
jgi:nucleotide-binding universal stress UspA family protein